MLSQTSCIFNYCNSSSLFHSECHSKVCVFLPPANEVLGKVMFTHLSVTLERAWLRAVHDWEREYVWLGRWHAWLGRDRRSLQQTVCILLECILVLFLFAPSTKQFFFSLALHTSWAIFKWNKNVIRKVTFWITFGQKTKKTIDRPN